VLSRNERAELVRTMLHDVLTTLCATPEVSGTIVVTVDVVARQNFETLSRMMRTDTRDCSSCHALSAPHTPLASNACASLQMSGVVCRVVR